MKRFPEHFFTFLFLFLGTFLFFSGPAWAGADVFVIENLKVDARAGNVQEARKKALAEGQNQALKQLLKKLTPLSEHERIDNVTFADAAVYVKSLEVLEERTSDVRYMGTLNIEFSPNLVREFLKFNNLQYAETVSKPLLVLPVLEKSGQAFLWEETNPWRSAWLEFTRQDGGYNTLMPFMVPLGDIEDMKTFSANDIVFHNKWDEESLQKLAKKYNARGVLLSVAKISPDPLGRGAAGLEITSVLLLPGQGISTPWVEKFAGPDDKVIPRAVTNIAGAFVENWKQKNLITAGGENDSVDLKIPVASLNDWVKTQSVLKSIGIIRELSVREIHKHYVLVGIQFSGDLESLRSALAQRNLMLDNQSSDWVLRSL